jgi:alpha-L-fucosidase
MGPKIDIVGKWAKAARNAGLRFGVSEHLWVSYKWFSVSHGHDATGPYAGVPYDGADPRNETLYIDSDQIWPTTLDWSETGIPTWWKHRWYLRMKYLIDQHQPDMLYTDGPLPFEDYGLNIIARLYNQSAMKNRGDTDGVYTCKRVEDAQQGVAVLDVERGVINDISPRPWQTDTCIGQWHYKRGQIYKTPKAIIDILVDVVSRNGNLMLNFPLPASGALDPEELTILAEITRWMDINAEAIHGTRPWKISGTAAPKATSEERAAFNEEKRKDLTADDVRFTTKGSTLYAFIMGWPEKETLIRPLAPGGDLRVGRIQRAGLLGFDGNLDWSQDDSGLRVTMPPQKPCDHAVVLKISGAMVAP